MFSRLLSSSVFSSVISRSLPRIISSPSSSMIKSLRSSVSTSTSPTSSSFHSPHHKILCVLYPGGMSGKNNPSILGCVENALGLPSWLRQEHPDVELIVTSEREGNEFENHLKDATVVITEPFWPAYLTKQRINKAEKLQLALTAGVGSDHVDLQAAVQKKLTVAEITGSNVVSVAEHVVMQILVLIRNFVPAYKQVIQGEWDVAAIADNAFDLEEKHVGTVGAGRIGLRVLQRLSGFNCVLHYYDKFRLTVEAEKELNVQYHPTVESLVKVCDVVSINVPLHPETENLFNEQLIAKMKPKSYLVNTARGKIVNRDAIVDALETEHLNGYAGDVTLLTHTLGPEQHALIHSISERDLFLLSSSLVLFHSLLSVSVGLVSSTSSA